MSFTTFSSKGPYRLSLGRRERRNSRVRGAAFVGLPFDKEIPAGDWRRVDLPGFSISTVPDVMGANGDQPWCRLGGHSLREI